MKTLRQLRREAELTQQQVADLLHVDHSTYGGYERGHRSVPPDVLRVLKEKLGWEIEPKQRRFTNKERRFERFGLL